ncbi:alpha/beta fold hydrolase [Candidatus Woesearchaeota archaeon]|nr:alpha/beta fold hydrolase [Candidatus Woesearchaeota archaeon]
MNNISFQNKDGLTLRGFVYKPAFGSDTAILFLHGFPGHCSGTARRFCRVLSFFGYTTMSFDFSGSDTSDGKFSDKLMSKEVVDVKYAIDFLENKYGFKKLFLIGISTGAIDAALYAHADKRVSGVVLLSGVADLKRGVHYDFTAEEITDFKRKKYIVYDRLGKWYHGKKLKKAFYDEFFVLDIPRALKKLKKPLLIVHGSKDEAVPLLEAKDLYKTANEPKKLVVISGADHQFSSLWHGLQVLRHVVVFIRQH